MCACGMEIIIASRIGQLVGRPEGFDGGKVGETLECEVLKVVAKGAQGAWTEWERGSFSCELVIGLVVLKVVEERVEVRLFWRVPRVRLAYVEILLERGREIKTTTAESKSIGVYRELCCYSVAMPWLTDRSIDDCEYFGHEDSGMGVGSRMISRVLRELR